MTSAISAVSDPSVPLPTEGRSTAAKANVGAPRGGNIGSSLQSVRIDEKRSSADAPANQPTTEDLKRISSGLQQQLQKISPELSFSVDQSSGRTVIRVTDSATGNVIRQIPSDEALALGKAIDSFEKSFLVRSKA